MLIEFRNAGLVWPTVAAIVGLSILIGLGQWQWSKSGRQEARMAAIAARATAEPVPPARAAELVVGDRDTTGLGAEYTRVRLVGRFDHANEMHVYAGAPDGAGWHIFTPLRLTGDITGRSVPVVWVNRGFVPDRLKQAQARPGSQPAGEQTVVGLVRQPQGRNMFVPADDPTANIWYTADPCAMQRAAFPSSRLATSCDGRLNYVAAERSGGPWPRGGTTELKLTNKHTGYALTWFGLALTLIGVYATFAWQRLKDARGRSGFHV